VIYLQGSAEGQVEDDLRVRKVAIDCDFGFGIGRQVFLGLDQPAQQWIRRIETVLSAARLCSSRRARRGGFVPGAACCNPINAVFTSTTDLIVGPLQLQFVLPKLECIGDIVGLRLGGCEKEC